MKILIAIDTNRINTSNYKNGLLGGDFETIVDYIQTNQLQSDIRIAIPETVTREIFNHKRKQYDEDITKLNTDSRKIQGTPGHTINIITPDPKGFYKLLKEDMEKQIHKYEFVKIPRLSNVKKTEALDSIIENCNEDQSRLNDQLIIEEIKHYRYLQNYDRIILYTDNIGDFQNYIPDNIEISISWEILKDSLDAIFLIGDTEEEIKFKKFLETDYPQELIKEACKDTIGSDLELTKVQYDHMVPEVFGEEAFFVVKFEGIGKGVKYKIWGEAFFNTTNTIDNIEINYQ